MLKKIIHYFDHYTFISIWFIFFMTTLAIILMVQLFLLPYIFTTWHAGNGLLIVGDWNAFHLEAVKVAERIAEEGWSAWQLRPKGWMPAGVASAIYALTWPKPWVLAPLNAAVHATTALVLVKFILFFVYNRKVALVAALPFIFFPSSMLLYTQIHRDGYYILGMLLFLYGLIYIVKLVREAKRLSGLKGFSCKNELEGFLTMLLGVMVIWSVRPHALIIYQNVGLALFLLTAIYFLALAYRKKYLFGRVFTQISFLIVVIITIMLLTSTSGADKYILGSKPVTSMKDSGEDIFNTNNNVEYPDDDYNWEITAWLPSQVDNYLRSMAFGRSVAYQEKYGRTASGIDYDVSLHSICDFLLYLPRALQIAFFAPFPVEWFGEGSSATTTFFRRVSAFEMVFIYLTYIPLIYGFWIWRKRFEIYITVMFAVTMMLPIVYSVPNVGTIYRLRYGFLMLLITLGIAAFIHYLQGKQKDFRESIIDN